MAKRVLIHPDTPNRRTIAEAVEVLRGGGIVAYPTDTIYGLGVDISQRKAVERLYRVRELDPKHPLSFLCEDLSHISRFAWISTPQYRVLKRMIPGPYTFVLEASREVPKHMVKKKKEVGIRVPDHAVPLALVRELGHPVVSTSCGTDPETGQSLSDPGRIEEVLGSQIDMILDAGPLLSDPSTVLRFLDDEEVEVLREGEGDIDELLSG